jgi:maltodextrin utilization protein YvdJ
MGTGIEYICEYCGYMETISVGVGFHHSSLDTILDEVIQPCRDEVKDILTKFDVVKKEYDCKLYSCKTCKEIKVYNYVKLEYVDKDNKINIYKTVFKCNECNKKLIEIKKMKNVYKCKCPKCKKLQSEIPKFPFMIDWD